MFQEQEEGRPQNTVSKEQMGEKEDRAGLVRVLTGYRKPEVDDTQENDLNCVFKGVVTLQLQGGEGSVRVSSLPFFL